jgi:signal peptidase I
VNKKLNPFISAFLSFLIPGMGQIYNSQFLKGIIFYLIGYFLVLLLLLLVGFPMNSVIVFLLIFFTLFIWRLYVIVDAFYTSYKQKQVSLTWYNKWYFLILIFILLLVFSNIVQIIYRSDIVPNRLYVIPSGSMMPTLRVGDMIIVNTRYYNKNQPQRGDVVSYLKPGDKSNAVYEKRIVGLPGEFLELRKCKLCINNKMIEENYEWINDNLNFGPVKIPNDSYFVMGDNRPYSSDSRYYGCIYRDKITGKVEYIYWSRSSLKLGKRIQ